MSKDGQVFLKPGLLGGFEKKAVLQYIFELNENALSEQQKLTDRIDELTKERDDLAKSLRDNEQKLLDAQNELSASLDKLSEYEAKSAETDADDKKKSDEISRLGAVVAQKNEDIARHISLNEELDLENRELKRKMQSFSEKRSQYEHATSQLGEIIAEAKTDAAKIIEQAKATAASITAGAGTQAENITQNAKAAAKKHVADTNAKIEDVCVQFDSFLNELHGFRQIVAGECSVLNEKIDALGKSAQALRTKTPDSPLKTASFPQEKPESFNESAAVSQQEPKKHGLGFFRSAAED